MQNVFVVRLRSGLLSAERAILRPIQRKKIENGLSDKARCRCSVV